jgi:hypothetical protein
MPLSEPLLTLMIGSVPEPVLAVTTWLVTGLVNVRVWLPPTRLTPSARLMPLASL